VYTEIDELARIGGPGDLGTTKAHPIDGVRETLHRQDLREESAGR
jgi:hypothetical protein